RTGQAQSILPKPFRSDEFRMLRTQPILFSPLDPHLLFFAANTLWQTTDGGQHWTQISPDLTRKSFDVPAGIGKFRSQPSAQPRQRGVIYAVAPSPLEKNRIWAGTDDGLIHLTTNGGKDWTDVTPPSVTAWQKISIIDAGHFDANTAYAAVNTIRLDDLHPHIYRTNDRGKTWQEIVRGIPDNENVNVVREDPRRRGLLFAGTERAVYVSYDDGENWSSLRLNMPATSVRDLIVKDDDLAVGTHGRGFWILDNITPLRQFDAGNQETVLFKPQTAMRVRWDVNTDTPLPPDEPVGENPPEGAMIDYRLGPNTDGPITLEVQDSKNNVVRRYSSTDPVPPPNPKLKIPRYWVRPPQVLPGQPGMHRFFWDMHLEPLKEVEADYPMTAVLHKTAPLPTGPWAMPGDYSVVLSVGGKTFTQPLPVKMDPRLKASAADLAKQFELSKLLYATRAALQPIGKSYESLVAELAKAKETAGDKPVKEQIEGLTKKLQEFADPARIRTGQSLELDVLSKVEKLFGDLQEVDAAPTSQAEASALDVQRDAQSVTERWRAIPKEVASLNSALEAA
ncbi:MAG TPA: hypothetical protein VLO30_10045, partial [Chthoniobacterales bacterium]|nr:hypothetical protein [Chthoniobacterales bacterium]